MTVLNDTQFVNWWTINASVTWSAWLSVSSNPDTIPPAFGIVALANSIVELASPAIPASPRLSNITFQFKRNPDYAIYEDDVAYLMVSAKIVRQQWNGVGVGAPACVPTVGIGSSVWISAGQLSIQSTYEARAAEVLATATTAVTTATALVSASGAADAQVLALLSFMSCGSNLARAQGKRLLYTISPFIDFGPIWIVAGNILLAAGFFLTQLLIVAIAAKCDLARFPAAGALVRFPSFSYVLTNFLIIGIVHGSTRLLAEGSNMTPVEGVLGVLGFLLSIAFIASYWFVLRDLRFRWISYGFFHSRSKAVKWLYPRGYWHPPETRNRFGKLFTSFGEKYLYWGAFPVIGSILPSVFTGLPFLGEAWCIAIYVLLALNFGVVFIIVAKLRPYRSPFLNISSCMNYLCLFCIVLLKALTVNEIVNGSSRRMLDKGQEVLGYIQMALILIRCLYSLITQYLEIKYWRRLSELSLDEDSLELITQREVPGLQQALLDRAFLPASAAGVAKGALASSHGSNSLLSTPKAMDDSSTPPSQLLLPHANVPLLNVSPLAASSPSSVAQFRRNPVEDPFSLPEKPKPLTHQNTMASAPPRRQDPFDDEADWSDRRDPFGDL